MELLKHDSVSFATSDKVFRHSPTRLIAGATALTLIAAAAFALRWPPAWYLAVVVTGMLLILRPMIVARLQRTNWLARVTDEGVLIHFRNHLNFHFPQDTPTVARVEFGDIASAHRARIKWQVRDERGVMRHTRELVELILRAEHPELAAALAAERSLTPPRERTWYGSTAMRFRGHPVRLADLRRLQIEWNVAQPAEEFLAALRAQGVQTSAPVTVDVTDDQSEREKLLMELVESGRQAEAMQLARAIYGHDMREAKRFVDELSGDAGRASLRHR